MSASIPPHEALRAGRLAFGTAGGIFDQPTLNRLLSHFDIGAGGGNFERILPLCCIAGDKRPVLKVKAADAKLKPAERNTLVVNTALIFIGRHVATSLEFLTVDDGIAVAIRRRKNFAITGHLQFGLYQTPILVPIELGKNIWRSSNCAKPDEGEGKANNNRL
jgi:hypothetical protein